MGIGASAGGLEAMTQLLTHLPPDTGMAYVLVQHLDPKHESMLKDILSRSTRMPVKEVETGMEVQKDQVYVIPPNFGMELVDGSFKLVPRIPEKGRHMPVDHFLRSLAEHCKTRAIGVILSGSNSDGSLGLQSIKAEGGIGFAQDESSAKFKEMPRAAVSAGRVDYVLPPSQIARELARIGRHLASVAPPAKAPEQGIVGGPRQLMQILSLVRSAGGVDFSLYRETTIRRRIARRMILSRVEDPADYVNILRGNPAEVRALYEDLLITVTAFFRDPATFRVLEKRVFPQMLKGKSPGFALRVWVPGCATGEEAYSIAIGLFEACSASEVYPSIQVFATDVSDASLQRARTGIYMENSLVDVSRERIRGFFKKVAKGYQVSKAIRDVCVFAKQNIAADPPFSNLDLLSCRNLLIYLEPALQKRVIPLFHYALNPGGYMVLGSSESIGGFADLFSPVDAHHRVFVKKAGIQPRLEFPAVRRLSRPGTPDIDETDARALGAAREAPLGKLVDKLILTRFAPAGVVVDENLNIVQFRGRTGPYLEAAHGAPNMNLLKMARAGMVVELRAAVQKAKKTHGHVREEGIRVETGRDQRTVNIDVLPLDGEDSKGHFLVLFEPSPDRRPLRRIKSGSEGREDGLDRLTRELAATKEYLQSSIEDQEASNEELKSANEEILSSNEELQSSNEELETAKEELQSTNEELSTINEALERSNADLAEVNNDLSNLLSSVNIPIVMVGAASEIRRFTPPAQKLLNLIPTDIGRPIGDIKPNITGASVAEAVRDVVETVTTREREIQDSEGRWYLMRVRPYRTSDNRIEGAVVAFLDIDPLKRSLEQVSRERYFAEMLVDTVRESLILLDDRLRVTTANHAFYTTFQRTPLQTEGKFLYELPDWEWTGEGLRGLLEQVAEQDARIDDLEIESEFVSLGRRTLLINARQLRAPGVIQRAVLLAVEDITKRKAAEKELRASEERYRQIFESSHEGIWILDAETGEILDVNRFLLDFLGVERKELVGRKSWEVGVYEDAEAARVRFAELQRAGHDINADVVMITRSGARVHLEAVRNIYEGASRRIAQFNYRDITQRRQLEDQMREIQKMESIGQLAGGLAHDFNNILNVVSVYTAIIARDAAGSKFAQPIGVIEKAISRGAAVVHQLLTFARKAGTEFQEVDPNAVVGEVVELIGQTFPPTVGVKRDLESRIHSMIADGNQLHQAVLNLCMNARDAMPNGGVLAIRTSLASGREIRQRHSEAVDESYVVIEVSDTGIGMDEETCARIFEPFFTTKASAGGSGLGLPVVYGIVRNHKGFVDVKSRPGEGTTVRMSFPAGLQKNSKK